MTFIEAKEINVRNILVAAYNSDPFNVADANAYGDIYETLDNADQGLVEVYTSKDEEFEHLANLLDYTSDNLPSAIYVANDLTFAMDETLPTIKYYKIVDTRAGEQKGQVIMSGMLEGEALDYLLKKAAHICDRGAQNEVILCERDARATMELCGLTPEQNARLMEIIEDGVWGVFTNVDEGCELLYERYSTRFCYDGHEYEMVAE